MKAIAGRWIAERRAFPGLVWWPRATYAVMSNAEIIEAIEALAAKRDAFAYPIEFIKRVSSR